MAVLPNLKQVVAGKLGQSFKKFVGGIGKGSIGALPSMSDFAKLSGGAKGGLANLSFPLDVTSGPENGNHGHYVIFFVNEQVNAKIGFSAIKEPKLDAQYSDFGMDSSVGKTHVNTNIKVPTAGGGSGPLDVRTYGTKQQQANSAIKSAFAKPNRAVVKRAPTRKGVASISMYMPAQVATTYGAQYNQKGRNRIITNSINTYVTNYSWCVARFRWS